MRSLVRQLPPVARRDEKIRRLYSENRRLDAALSAAEKSAQPAEIDAPSFARHVYADRRINAHLGERNFPGRGNQIARKLKSYSFAQSHGVRIPTLLGLWETPEEIPWDQLPDQVVLKSHTGAASRGVFPLRRVDDRWSVVTRDEPMEPAEIVAKLSDLIRDGRIGGPIFGQEFIGAGRDDALPAEVRVFGFYGEVGMANVLRRAMHGSNAGTRSSRYLEDGSPGPQHHLHFRPDDSDPPDGFETAVEIGRHLSAQITRPFVRIDFLDDDGDVVFGELTPRPGGSNYFGPEDDVRLGELWERAQARVLNDVIDGSDYSLKFGDGPRELVIGDRQYLPDQGWLAP